MQFELLNKEMEVVRTVDRDEAVKMIANCGYFNPEGYLDQVARHSRTCWPGPRCGIRRAQKTTEERRGE